MLAGLSLWLYSAMADDNPYIVRTKGVKSTESRVADSVRSVHADEDSGGEDFLSTHFRYQSMCDWKEGMRFMVIPEKVDLLINTFCDAETNKEVSSGGLRHHIMVYHGYTAMPNGRVHINFSDEKDGKRYYFELPNGTFDDYCLSKSGVPTLAYLGDVDMARELMMDSVLLTRATLYRVDMDNSSDGYKEVEVKKNIPVTVKAIGVGTRSYPVKIVVEDENGNQFFQNVAMSRTNSGLRDDEFILDKEKYFFPGSFEFTGDIMAVSDNIDDYRGKTVHNNHYVSMLTRGSGKMRQVMVPRFTGFIIDNIAPPVKSSNYYTLTLREVESRRIYYIDVVFRHEDIESNREGKEENFFGYLFGMGEGAVRQTSKETRVAIREGRVIPGMSKEEVKMTMGEPFRTLVGEEGIEQWMFMLTDDNVLDVWFSPETDHVVRAVPRMSSAEAKKLAKSKEARKIEY